MNVAEQIAKLKEPIKQKDWNDWSWKNGSGEGNPIFQHEIDNAIRFAQFNLDNALPIIEALNEEINLEIEWRDKDIAANKRRIETLEAENAKLGAEMERAAKCMENASADLERIIAEKKGLSA